MDFGCKTSPEHVRSSFRLKPGIQIIPPIVESACTNVHDQVVNLDYIWEKLNPIPIPTEPTYGPSGSLGCMVPGPSGAKYLTLARSYTRVSREADQTSIWQVRVMAFTNSCVSEPTILEHELYGPEPYDLNFVLPIPPQLSTGKLRLVPFIPRVHATTFFEGIRGHESMFQHMPLALEHPTDLLRFAEKCRRDKNTILFAVIDTTRPDTNHPEWNGSLAGMFGFSETERTKLVTEIGPAIVLPAFQRTHVGSHAVGLMLKCVLELPPFGWGFRKVRWTASPINEASNKLAKRMGFKLEGLLRWKYVVPMVEGYQKSGKEARTGDAGNGLLGRDSNEWAMCWDDWEENGKEIVERAFARTV